MEIKVINHSPFPLPQYATQGSAGLDLRANISEELVIAPGVWQLVPTGLIMELPEGFEAQIRPRSGLALKNGIGILNAPGTIDADYRGEIKIILMNFSTTPFTIQPGDRIAQMVIAKYEKVHFTLAEQLSETSRGTGGYGHSGV